MPFNFPDPSVSTTATNPVTGVTYQWKADRGKWVISGEASKEVKGLKSNLLSDYNNDTIVMTV